ncbi:C2H2-type zinc finger protein [Methanocaldococcus sp. 10A]
MDIEKVLEKLDIPKEGIFYKCPYCGYKNADKKVILKHIKSKHQEEIKKEVEKMNKRQQKRKPQRRGKQQNKEMIEYKDYLYLFAHKKRCLITLEDGTTIEGLVKAKDRFYIMLLDHNYTPKGLEKKPERVIIHKGHIVSIIPLEENKNNEKKD